MNEIQSGTSCKSEFCKWVIFGVVFISIMQSPIVVAQYGAHPVDVSYEYNRRGEVEFYASNRTLVPYILIITFTDLRNTRAPNPNPYIFTARRGRERIVTLKKFGLTDGDIGFGYRVGYVEGCHDSKPDNDIEYILPLDEGASTEMVSIGYAGEYIDKDAPEDFYVLGFSAEENDTVYASRRGTVTKIVDEYEDSAMQGNGQATRVFMANRNYIQVVHEDCTFGTYNWLKKGGMLVHEGDFVEAGEPIAVVTSRSGNKGHGFVFSLMNKKIEYEGTRINGEWEYLVPLYRTNLGKHTKLEVGKEYVSVHPEDVITKEMSRRERRRWRRNN